MENKEASKADTGTSPFSGFNLSYFDAAYRTGSLLSDFWFFFRNQHPIVSLFVSSPQNPLLRRYRILILIVNLLFCCGL